MKDRKLQRNAKRWKTETETQKKKICRPVEINQKLESVLKCRPAAESSDLLQQGSHLML